MTKSNAYEGIAWSVFGGEAIGVIFDLRWALVLVAALLATDFWWGKSESSVRYELAKKDNDQVGMYNYKFRWSRALRRTFNKTIDYITFVLIGTLIGLAITEPYELLTHTQTAAIGLLLAITIEVVSIWGHVKVVRHIGGKEIKFLGKIASIFIRKKSEDLANAIDDAIASREEQEITENIEP